MTSKAATACGRGMVFSVNADPAAHNTFKLAAIGQEGRDLKINAIVAQGAQPPQVASTVSILAAAASGNNVGAAAAAATGMSQVVPGQGQTGNGQQCGCSCLCGAGQVPPGVAQGGFGGFAGALNAQIFFYTQFVTY
jgi:hypothetical protein